MLAGIDTHKDTLAVAVIDRTRLLLLLRRHLSLCAGCKPTSFSLRFIPSAK